LHFKIVDKMMPSLLSKASEAAKNLKAPSIHSPVTLDNVTSRFGLSGITDAFSGSREAEHNPAENRYSSSAAISAGNNVKFHVDGCAYFWAVSEALLTVKESIWILGCKYLHPLVALRGFSYQLYRVGVSRRLSPTSALGKRAVSPRPHAPGSRRARSESQRRGV
jgi:phosphatidylserine/phosphatidylglycerophosphate/cardiolipin synthase-like enzyme